MRPVMVMYERLSSGLFWDVEKKRLKYDVWVFVSGLQKSTIEEVHVAFFQPRWTKEQFYEKMHVFFFAGRS